MGSTWAKIALVVVFVLIGGIFAATEMALVSLRESQVRTLAARGRRGQRVASLASDPNRFLAALQIGVTFAGFLSAAFGAATLADEFAPVLEGWGLPHGLATTVALVVDHAGDLLPVAGARRAGAQAAGAAARRGDRAGGRARRRRVRPAGQPGRLAAVALDQPGRARCSAATRRRAASRSARRSSALLVAGHASFGDEERELIEEVFEAGDRQLREVMVPRTEVDFLDASMPVYKAVRVVADLPHSRYPVIQGSADDVVGFVHVRDLFGADPSTRLVRAGPRRRAAAGHQAAAAGAVRDAPRRPAPGDRRRRVRRHRRHRHPRGPRRGARRRHPRRVRRGGAGRPPYRHAGDLEVDGLLNLDDFEDEAGLALPEGPYETVAGYVQASLGHIPQVGETVEHDGHRITVTETDGRRVSRLLVVPRPPDPAEPGLSE